MKKAVKESAVTQEEFAEVFVNGENTMTMDNIDKFKGHGGSALHGIEISAGGTKPAVAAERDKFPLSAARTDVHSAAKGRITAVNHFIHVFNNRITRV